MLRRIHLLYIESVPGSIPNCRPNLHLHQLPNLLNLNVLCTKSLIYLIVIGSIHLVNSLYLILLELFFPFTE